jgi:hypothetical protein
MHFSGFKRSLASRLLANVSVRSEVMVLFILACDDYVITVGENVATHLVF